MPNVVGVFYVLSGGVVVAIILAFIVVAIETRGVCKENEVRLSSSCGCFLHSQFDQL